VRIMMRFMRFHICGSTLSQPSARAAAILEGTRSSRITACGAYPVATLLELAPASGTARLLGRGDSGKEAPRRTYYAAVALG